MQATAYDIKAFYASRIGRIVRRIMQERIREVWPDLHGLRVMGYGYPVPYMRMFMAEAERIFNIMPAAQGAHHWPHDHKNMVAVAEETEIPLETSSVDRILMMHALEYSPQMHHNLAEMYRVLKPNGRILLVVPNRAGMWAHAEWSPLGQGTPYSVTQLTHYLHENKFIQERVEEALFMPPYKVQMVMKSAGLFERLGKTFMPFVAGLHMVEASKQIYARPPHSGGSKVAVRARGLFGGTRPAAVPEGAGRL